ncbi:hypothetical protein Acr_08g0014430 [Actinidia rufa]|uniref:Uncharacterized protein n=1 Tax=Actinidia rufa TaxID=165716 RepID=A0A7J0F538_9ERIC|nr:hypothetical protein Acr_08g0014430 [Actinidia rufa]
MANVNTVLLYRKLHGNLRIREINIFDYNSFQELRNKINRLVYRQPLQPPPQPILPDQENGLPLPPPPPHSLDLKRTAGRKHNIEYDTINSDDRFPLGYHNFEGFVLIVDHIYANPPGVPLHH